MGRNLFKFSIDLYKFFWINEMMTKKEEYPEIQKFSSCAPITQVASWESVPKDTKPANPHAILN
jgi:hypothetical protein